jgi:hypothetical protein
MPQALKQIILLTLPHFWPKIIAAMPYGEALMLEKNLKKYTTRHVARPLTQWAQQLPVQAHVPYLLKYKTTLI